MENKVEYYSTNFFYAVGSRTFLGSIQAAGLALRYVTKWKLSQEEFLSWCRKVSEKFA